MQSKLVDDWALKGKLLKILGRLSSIEAGPGDDGDIDATIKRARTIASVSLALDEMSGLADEMR